MMNIQLAVILGGICSFMWTSTISHAANGQRTTFATFEELQTPAGTGSREPNLVVSAEGQVLLSWLEPLEPDRFALRFAVRETQTWSQPRTIATGKHWFVNWADFSSLAVFADRTLAAHWRVKNGGGNYGYDIRLALSSDDGATWGQAIVPHHDGSRTQHGFVSMFPWTDKLLVLWLDGRNYTATHAFAAGREAASDAMALRVATLDTTGALSNERILDPRVCTCCQPSAAPTPSGAIVAYRDRSENDIRDISVLRFSHGHWSEPRLVHDDGWRILGCPVNGPAIAADRHGVAVAWYTAAQNMHRVQVAFSSDGGQTFSRPVRVDNGNPAGRVDTIFLPDGAALVSWLEMTAWGEEFRIRRVQPNGSQDQPIRLAVTRQGRTSGFPRMVRNRNEVYVAWTQAVSSGPTPKHGQLMIRSAVGRLKSSD